MRRKEREVTEKSRIEAFLTEETILRVGFYDNGEIYIVPVNYGFVGSENGGCFYFHGARAGRKFELAKASPKVGFEVDGRYRLLPSENACSHSAAFLSVVGTGRLSLVTDVEEVKRGLQCLMKQATHRDNWEFSEASLARVAVFRLDVETLTCKESGKSSFPG